MEKENKKNVLKELFHKLLTQEIMGVVDINDSVFTEQHERIVITLHDLDGTEKVYPIRITKRLDVSQDALIFEINDPNQDFEMFKGLTIAFADITEKTEQSAQLSLSEDEIKALDQSKETILSEGGSPVTIRMAADKEELEAIANGISPYKFRKEKEQKAKRDKEKEDEIDRLYEEQDKYSTGGRAGYKKEERE